MQPEDLPAMHSIYSWYVNHSAWNLDWQPQSLEAFSSFLLGLCQDWPVLAALDRKEKSSDTAMPIRHWRKSPTRL